MAASERIPRINTAKLCAEPLDYLPEGCQGTFDTDYTPQQIAWEIQKDNIKIMAALEEKSQQDHFYLFNPKTNRDEKYPL